ncbi:hypothetical protein M513_12632 [Trichuris suis]|uniref:Uncharacterized protein n=1 Tax=Trichuris suis TaxID=68888 RepID=A0A085LNE4_9BILA|nr:hypothetical protein M513_12632 [Trichuris suis]
MRSEVIQERTSFPSRCCNAFEQSVFVSNVQRAVTLEVEKCHENKSSEPALPQQHITLSARFNAQAHCSWFITWVPVHGSHLLVCCYSFTAAGCSPLYHPVGSQPLMCTPGLPPLVHRDWFTAISSLQPLLY